MIEDATIIEDCEPLHTIEGIIDPLDVADELEDLYCNGITPGVSTGYHTLDEIYTVKPGQWTIVTGAPSSGKSTFVDNLLVNLSRKHGWKHLVCSPENQPVSQHIANISSIYAGKEFRKGAMHEDEYLECLRFVQDNFRFINPPEKDFTVNYILNLALTVEENGFNFTGFVIDPYNELEHKRPSAMNETEYVSWMLSRLRRYVRDRMKHMWFVAHPTKLRKVEQRFTESATMQEMTKAVYPVATMYDISGSAHFFNKADMGISVWRDKNDDTNKVQVHVQKVRFRHSGRLGMRELNFDWKSGRYFENW